jgi:hypothetical protein
MVAGLRTSVSVQILNDIVELPVKNIADGCIGVSLWFKNKKDAYNYAEDDLDVIEYSAELKSITKNSKK